MINFFSKSGKEGGGGGGEGGCEDMRVVKEKCGRVGVRV